MRVRLFSWGLLSLLLAAPAGGQVHIMGRVIDDLTGTPLGQVRVTLRAPDGSALGRQETDAMGVFEFSVARIPAVRIHAERMGYRANTTPLLRFDGRAFFQVEVRLDPEAILLAPLEVIAWSEVDRSPLLDAFRHRLATGNGIYITREEVERRKPMYVTDLLRSVPGVQLMGVGAGYRPIVQVGRSEWRSCTTQLFVDGFLVNRPVVGNALRLDDLVSPASVEGIEIYRGLSTVPPEFLTPDAECGVVAVWTRRGGRRPSPPPRP